MALSRHPTHSIRRLDIGRGDQLLGSTAKSRGRALATIQGATDLESMKIGRLMTLIVGITSLALSPLAWAGHGGGSGGHGGGFNCGRFHGGGFHGSGFHGDRFHHGNFNDRFFFFNGFGDPFFYYPYPYYWYYPFGYYPYCYGSC